MQRSGSFDVSVVLILRKSRMKAAPRDGHGTHAPGTCGKHRSIDSHRFRVETRRDVIFGVCVGLKWWTSPQFELLSFAKRGKRERECKERLRGTFVKGAAAAKAGRAAEEAAPPQRAEKKQLSAKILSVGLSKS